MEDAGGEGELRRLEGVVLREGNREEEYSSGIGRSRRSHDARVPLELLFACRARRAVSRRVFLEVGELFLNSAKCHSF